MPACKQALITIVVHPKAERCISSKNIVTGTPWGLWQISGAQPIAMEALYNDGTEMALGARRLTGSRADYFAYLTGSYPIARG